MKKISKKPEILIIAAFIAVNSLVHFIAGLNSGFHGDELLHIESGRHLAAGYMDFPPVIAVLAFIQNLFQSDSLFVNHLFVYLASAMIYIFAGLTTIELGGKWLAVLTVLSCFFFSPGIGASHSLFLPVLFEQLFWTVCIYYLVRYSNNSHPKYLILLGIFAAFGFLTKYSTAFLIAGIVISVFIVRRDLLKNRFLWLGLMLFLLIILPNLLWQFKNGFPVFHHFSELYKTQLNKTSILQELKSLILFLNPLTSVLWVCGLLITPFLIKLKKYRLVSFSLFFAFFLLIIAKGKSYYFFPVILGILPFSAVLAESFMQKRKWILFSYLMLIFISGIYLLPNGISILPLKTYIKIYYPGKSDTEKIPLPFENYYSAEIWKQILEKVSVTYQNLPETERKSCLILGRHYSQAGGINLMGKKYSLPPAFSFHSSFYNWVPDFQKDITIIVISDFSWDREHWLNYFDEVEPVCIIQNRFASDNEWSVQHIYLCRKLKFNSNELKQKFSSEIF